MAFKLAHIFGHSKGKKKGKNPAFLGVDLEDGLAIGGGLFLVDYTKQKGTDWLVQKIKPLAKLDGWRHDLVNLGSSMAAAAVDYVGVSLFSERFGRDMGLAGVGYAAATGLSIPFKGHSFGASTSQFFSNLRTNAQKADPTQQLNPPVSNFQPPAPALNPAAYNSSPAPVGIEVQFPAAAVSRDDVGA